jgi:ATP-binding cassette subfamily B protein
MLQTNNQEKNEFDGEPTQKVGWIKGLIPYVLSHKKSLYIAFSSAIVGTFVTAVLPLIQRQIINSIENRGSLNNINYYIVAMLVLGVISFVAAYVRRYWGGKVSLNVQNDLRNAIFQHLQRLDFAKHDELDTGQLVSRANSDIGLIQMLLAFGPMMFSNFATLLFSVVIMIWLSPLLSIVAIVILPLMFIVSLRLRDAVFPASWVAQQQEGVIAEVVDDTVTGIRVVKAFGAEANMSNSIKKASKTLFNFRNRVYITMAKLQSTLQALPALAQVGILAMGGYMAIHHKISLGTYLAFSTYLISLVGPVRMFAGLMAFGQQAKAGAERVLDLLNSTPEVVDAEDAAELNFVVGEITFENVNFGYTSSELILDNMCFKIEPGETVALVGASGCGKSTVSMLIPRFYDVTSGRILIDSRDVRTLKLTSLRDKIGFVFDDSFLFSESISDNIAFGNPSATFDQIKAAAVAVEADDFIKKLPNGYDTIVGEKGLTLSGGQRQRIALARALISDPKILILDDATSAIDAKTEEEIHKTLTSVMVGRTTLLIAHRKSTINLADRIVLIDRGKVVDGGTQAELFERSQLFRSLLTGEDIDHISSESDLEAISTLDAQVNSVLVTSVTKNLWPYESIKSDFNISTNKIGTANLGAGMGGGGGMMGNIGAMLAPTEELMEKVAKLPQIELDPNINVEKLEKYESSFRFSRFLKPFYGAFLVGVILVLIDTVLTVSGPLLIKSGIDSGVTKSSANFLFIASAIYLSFVLLDWIDNYFETRYIGKVAARISYALRIKIFSQLLRLGLDFYEREMGGRVMTRMTTDVLTIGQLVQSGLITALVNIFTFFIVAMVLFVTNIKLAFVALSVVPVLLIATQWFRVESAKIYKLARDKIAVVNANLQEGISGIRVSQAYNQSFKQNKDFAKLSGSYLDSRVKAQWLVSIYFPFVLLLSDISAALVMGFGSHLVADRQLQIGALLAFVLLVNLLFSPIQQLSQTFDQYQQATASLNKIKELMLEKVIINSDNCSVESFDFKGNISIKNVSFSYPGFESKVLDDVSFEINQGQTVAIVGHTGAGKSTIVKLLARFYDPDCGEILIDNYNLKDVDPTFYKNHIGYVPQEAHLFTGTIRDNIAFAKKDATDLEIENAARAVGAHAFISKLPNGYLEFVKSQGKSLSSGQRQLISLARVKLSDPKLLLLDEATANLDLHSEQIVSKAMSTVAKKSTTILIAHRLQTVLMADFIAVIDGGKLVQFGTHEELLKVEGVYSQMWDAYVMPAI